MSLSVKIEKCLSGWNVLSRPTVLIGRYLESHPTIFKIALIINHLFRAAMMVGLMFIRGLRFYISLPICFISSLFYRLTVEKNCAYKFALPAFLGSVAFMLIYFSINRIIQKTALHSVGSSILICASFLPILLYAGYICFTVNSDVNKNLVKMKDRECCQV